MNDPGRKTIFWVLATLVLAMLPQAFSMPLPILAVAAFPILWRTGSELYDWKALPALVRHGITVLALALLFTSYGDLSGRRAAVSLLATMLALKMIECYRIRDVRLVVCFSLFLCATQFLFSQGVLMPLYGGATVILALVTLAQLQRTEAWAHEGQAPPVRASVFSELGFSLRLLALAVPAGLAFFILFPRLPSPLWGIPDSTLDAKSGLSDSMSPGSIQNLFMDDSPAFRVQFYGRRPPPESLYWRGPVFWSYDGERWTGSYHGKNTPATAIPEVTAQSWDYNVQLEPNEQSWLFALDYPVTVPQDTKMTMDFQLIRRDPVIQLIQYAVISNPEFVDSPELSDGSRALALQLPEDRNPRTRALIERWRRETPDDVELVRRALNHFNEQEFHYALNAPRLGYHAADDFMFDTRTGFCEHYASTFTVMMRMAGIPTRIVTGYQGGWYSDLGDYLLVRQSDAHAWTEVWLPDSGWTRVDPTAAVSPLRVQQGSLGALNAPRHILDYSWLRSLRNTADFAQQRWNDWIIEYGAGRQARLFAPLGLDQSSPTVLVGALILTIGILSAFVFPFILRLRGPAVKDPIQQIWHKFLKKMEKAGFESLPSDGAMELAEAASVRMPEHAEPIINIASLYTRSRYAAEPPAFHELKQAIQQFRPNKMAG